jgi:DcuC family C4-dicarboxylate transporter
VLLISLLLVAGAVYLMVRRVEVRLVLLGAGCLLSLLGGSPLVVADTFTRGMVAPMVAPICAAMGFAAVLRMSGCDRELVLLLLTPFQRARWLMLPGGILAAYLVNAAVPSQTSAAAALGPILIPLLLAAGVRAEIAGAALILGASFGGDLLNPGAQDVQASASAASIAAAELSARVIPAGLAGMGLAALWFGVQHRPGPAGLSVTGSAAPIGRPNLLKASIPAVPVVLLLSAYGGVPWLQWLVAVPEGSEPLKGALPVVRAMLVGVVLAALSCGRELPALVRELFDGMGGAYASIISLTITAQCFGAGLAAAGVGAALLEAFGRFGSAGFRALAAVFPWALALLSGSGSGPILTFAQTFLAPSGGPAEHEKVLLSALACLAGAIGRTMSPVAAVVIYSSGLAEVPPLAAIRPLLPALLAGGVFALVVALLR